jgi:metal-dependent amidase/aminoacylase/carboxypeptidase family protein
VPPGERGAAELMVEEGFHGREGPARHDHIQGRSRGRAASRAWYATITGKPAHGAYPEDFSFFAQEVPGFYFTVGAVKPGTTSGGHHTPTFLADDAAVPVGMR